MSQIVSMFSAPIEPGRRVYAVVPQEILPAFNRLYEDDPVWRKGELGGVRHEATWKIDTDRYRCRLRDELKAWVA